MDPHVHLLVPGGGLTANGLRWLRVQDPQFLFPQVKLAARFKGRLQAWLQTKRPALRQRAPPQVWWQPWVADVQPVGSGEAALKYLAAYLCRPLVHERQLEHGDAHTVTFRYRDNGGGEKRCTVSGQELVRRFLEQVLPKGFPRVRHYGWLGAVAKERRDRIHALLDWKPPLVAKPAPTPPPRCPVCGQPMRCVAQLPRAPP